MSAQAAPAVTEDDELDRELLELMGDDGVGDNHQAPSTKRKAPPSGGKRSAGTTASSKRKKRGKRDSSDDDSDERYNYDSDDLDGLSDFDTDELTDYDEMEDGDDDGDDDEHSALTLAERQLLDESVDEEELRGMNELEREELLANRAEKRQQLLERLEIQKRLRAGASGARRKTRRTPAPSKSKTRSKQKLELLKARRSGVKTGLSDLLDDDEDLDAKFADEDSDDDEAYRRRLRKTFDTEERQAGEHGDRVQSRDIRVEELHQIQITRQNLEKWMFATFFQEVAVGCFIRVAIGPGPDKEMAYRVGRIDEVIDYHRVYKINGVPTKKALRVSHGKAQRVFLMDVVSNKPFTEAEFRRWEKTMKSEKQNLPSASTLKRKRVDLDKARKYAFTNEEVDAIIQEKAKIVPTAKNLSRERVKLLYAKDQLAQDGLDASHVTSKLHKIDSIIEEMKPAKVDVWAKLNERNRKRNVAEGSQAEILARSDKVKGSARTGNDPFARIKAVPTQIFETPSGEDGLVGPSTSPIKQQPSPHVIDGDGRSTNGHVTMETATTHNAGASSFDSLFDDIDI